MPTPSSSDSKVESKPATKESATAAPERKAVSQNQRILLLGVSAALAALALGQLGFMRKFEDRVYDHRFDLRRSRLDPTTQRPRHINPHIALVGIGDNDVRGFGPMPWPRSRWADMMPTFTNAGSHPRAVGYDVLFTTAKTEAIEAAGDDRFVDAIRESGVVCLAANVESILYQKTETEDQDLFRWVSSQSVRRQGVAEDALLDPHRAISLPAPIFTQGSHLGIINAIRDEDSVHRRMPILIHQGNYWIPSLSMRMIMLYHQVDASEVRVEPGHVAFKKLNGQEVRIPVEEDGDFLLMRVNYRGSLKDGKGELPLDDFPMSTFAGVVDWVKEDLRSGKGKLSPKDFATLQRFMTAANDGLVLIGQTSTGADVGATPLSAGTALVDCHLNVLNTILNEDFVHMVSLPQVALLTLGMSLLAAWATQKFSAVTGSAVSVATLLLFLIALWTLFVSKSIVIPLIVPSVGLFLAYTTGTTMRFMGEERQKRQIRRSFQNYLSANIMEEVLKNPDAMKMGGSRKELTVLFTDVRGFTTFCEKNQPETVVPILNELLDTCSEVIVRHDGTLDKYIGDAIMAFWGAPVTQPDHAVRAAKAAIEMREAMDRLRQDWEKRGIPHLHLGIGVNSGEMLVGNVGSSRLRNYTVIGDEVNLGARLEAETRKHDTDIIISESVASRLGDGFRTRFLDEVKVKGKEKPVRIYALEGLAKK